MQVGPRSRPGRQPGRLHRFRDLSGLMCSALATATSSAATDRSRWTGRSRATPALLELRDWLVCQGVTLVMTEAPRRQLRDLTRYRRALTRGRTREKQRAEKVLEDAQIKLSSVITDIFGASGAGTYVSWNWNRGNRKRAGRRKDYPAAGPA